MSDTPNVVPAYDDVDVIMVEEGYEGEKIYDFFSMLEKQLTDGKYEYIQVSSDKGFGKRLMLPLRFDSVVKNLPTCYVEMSNETWISDIPSNPKVGYSMDDIVSVNTITIKNEIGKSPTGIVIAEGDVYEFEKWVEENIEKPSFRVMLYRIMEDIEKQNQLVEEDIEKLNYFVSRTDRPVGFVVPKVVYH